MFPASETLFSFEDTDLLNCCTTVHSQRRLPKSGMQVTVFDKDGRGKAGKHYRVSGTFVEEIIKKKKKPLS